MAECALAATLQGNLRVAAWLMDILPECPDESDASLKFHTRGSVSFIVERVLWSASNALKTIFRRWIARIRSRVYFQTERISKYSYP
jgi:hypothetical protein